MSNDDTDLVPRAEIDQHRPWLTARHAKRLCLRGELPYFVIGRRVWLDLSDVDSWRESQRVAS